MPSGALADSKPQREAWPGAAPGTSQAKPSQAAVASPSQPGADSPIGQTLPFCISYPKALQQVGIQPQKVFTEDYVKDLTPCLTTAQAQPAQGLGTSSPPALSLWSDPAGLQPCRAPTEPAHQNLPIPQGQHKPAWL